MLALAARFTEAPSFKGKGAANAEYKDANNTTTREYKKRDMSMINGTVIVRRGVCKSEGEEARDQL